MYVCIYIHGYVQLYTVVTPVSSRLRSSCSRNSHSEALMSDGRRKYLQDDVMAEEKVHQRVMSGREIWVVCSLG